MAEHQVHHHAGEGASRALSEDAIVRTSRLKANAQGYWQILYNVRDEKGGWRSKTFSTKTKDLATAQKELDAWLANARETTSVVDGAQRRLTISDLIDRYSIAKKLHRSMSVHYVLKPVRTLLGGLAPEDLNEKVIQNYKTARRNLRNGGTLKDGTLRRELGALIAVLNYAAKHKHIERSVLPVIELPDQSPARVLFMDKAQEEAFWTAAQARGGTLALFVAIGLDTAARKSAILGLTWDRIDLVRRLIDFREPGQAVTRKRRAVVPISVRLLPVLERAAPRPGVGASGRLFDSKLRKKYESFCQALGMEWVTAHVMRHTWASLAVQDGVPLFHIAKMLGDTMATVEHTYAHLQPTHLHDIVNRRWPGGPASPWSTAA
jgi:integrase